MIQPVETDGLSFLQVEIFQMALAFEKRMTSEADALASGMIWPSIAINDKM
jgi:hypothetical protein